MSESFKERMYNFEVTPPPGLFQNIVNEIEQAHPSHPSGKLIDANFSVKLIAASIVLFILAAIFLNSTANSNLAKNQDQFVYRIANDNTQQATLSLNTLTKKPYVTLLGPQGKVKVSGKVAALFIAPETPTKAQWNKKLHRWKNIMMTASTTNIMDVISVTQSAAAEN